MQISAARLFFAVTVEGDDWTRLLQEAPNTVAGKTGDPRVNPPTNGIARIDSQLAKIRSEPAGGINPLLLGGRRALNTDGPFQTSGCNLTNSNALLADCVPVQCIEVGQTPYIQTMQARMSHGGAVVRLLAFHSIPSRVTPGFSYVGIVSDDAAGPWVLSGISCFPPPPLHSRAAP
ncbi:hypothetical protein PR048_026278 [Dryococelus australis]|uniref:Uncharacterized protein n=1 Tax=Dryococelus australis TaxID=614101 RepID=A0ABQ9GKY2_9NEOP|nr:hypothetical protein PR048_026278 [Dryococelus australis]